MWSASVTRRRSLPHSWSVQTTVVVLKTEKPPWAEIEQNRAGLNTSGQMFVCHRLIAYVAYLSNRFLPQPLNWLLCSDWLLSFTETNRRCYLSWRSNTQCTLCIKIHQQKRTWTLWCGEARLGALVKCLQPNKVAWQHHVVITRTDLSGSSMNDTHLLTATVLSLTFSFTPSCHFRFLTPPHPLTQLFPFP